MRGSARYGAARKEGTWEPGTSADWAARRLACCKDTVRGGHRPPLGTPKQLTARNTCKNCTPERRGREAWDAWNQLVTLME